MSDLLGPSPPPPTPILSSGQRAVREELDRTAKESTNAARVDLDLEGIEGSVHKTWRNGWGVTAWVRRKWSGETAAGVRGEKKF